MEEQSPDVGRSCRDVHMLAKVLLLRHGDEVGKLPLYALMGVPIKA